MAYDYRPQWHSRFKCTQVQWSLWCWQSLSWAVRVLRTIARPLFVVHSIVHPRDQPTLDRIQKCSLEHALFPYLFPFDEGAYDGHLFICEYLRLRCSQLFAPFTSCKDYLLLMYHVCEAHRLSTNCSSSVLQHDMDGNTAEHPHATRCMFCNISWSMQTLLLCQVVGGNKVQQLWHSATTFSNIPFSSNQQEQSTNTVQQQLAASAFNNNQQYQQQHSWAALISHTL